VKFLFVGEKKSNRAVQMRVSWRDGRLAAKQLFDALHACGIDPTDCDFANWLNMRDRKKIYNAYADGTSIVGMGQIVQNGLTRSNISHIKIVHPAARGRIRGKALYKAHIRKMLCKS
jgi:hypothetical protein